MFTLYVLYDGFIMKNVFQLPGEKGYVKFVERHSKLNENQYITLYPKKITGKGRLMKLVAFSIFPVISIHLS